MSAQGGILCLQKTAQPDRASLDLLEASLIHLGPDAGDSLLAGQVGFVFRSFKTTQESMRENQPLFSCNLIVTFDGRLDNRLQLLEQLPGVQPATTDVELFLAAFLAWGTNAFAKILGDFAAAIWNTATRELILARDPFGVRKLFYYATRHRVVWASDLTALLNLNEVPDEVDEDFVGLSLAFLPDESSSPFKHLIPVKPAHYVCFSDGEVNSGRYWYLFDNLRETGARLDGIKEEFRDLLFNGVSACLRADRLVTAELSGGLDSSTIVSVADRLASLNPRSPQRVVTVSNVYDAAKSSDERDFISIMERQRGCVGTHIREDLWPVLSTWADPNFTSFPNRDNCFGGLTEMTIRAMGSMNSRVLLSGLFGDQLLISHHLLPYEAADLVHDGMFLQALRACYNWSLSNRQPLASVAWQAAVRPNLPAWLRRGETFKRASQRTSISQFSIPQWIEPAFAKRTHLRERIARLLTRRVSNGLGSKGLRYANLMEGVGYLASGYSEKQSTTSCIELRYPFLHRPLVEFLFSIPYRYLGNSQSARYLHRVALKGILPDPIRLRTDKRGPAEALFLGVSREWRSLVKLIEESRACERGFVSRTAILAETERWRYGQMSSDIIKFFSLEMWLRALERRRATLR